MQSIGIASAKIEGRMKRPEYVAAATLAAREARDLGFITEASQERLRSVFSRTVFTDGYLSGELGEKMFGFRQKSDVISADNRLLKEIRTLSKDEFQHVPVSFDCRVKTGEKLRLSASDGVHTVEVVSDTVAEKAVHVPLSEERVVQSLKKTGSTPYYAEKITTEISDDAAASAAAINALRRDALEQLDLSREICHNYRINEIDLSELLTGGECSQSMNRAVVRNLKLPEAMREMDMVFVDLFGLSDADELKKALNDGYAIGVEVPRATFGNEADIFERLKVLKGRGVSDLLAHNIAAVYMGKLLGFTVHAGFGMNIANSYTLLWAKEYGIATAVLSVELDLKHIESIYKSIPVGIIRYGYLPLMITRNVPSGKSCKTDPYLQDRKDERFPVICREGYCEIFNCVPLLMPQKDYPLKGEVFSDFLFTVDNSVENKEKNLQKLRGNRDFERKTHGLYLRGVKKLTIY